MALTILSGLYFSKTTRIHHCVFFLCNMTVQLGQEARDQALPKSQDFKTQSSDPVSPTFLAKSSGFGGMIPDTRELSASGTGIIDVMGVCDEPPLA